MDNQTVRAVVDRFVEDLTAAITEEVRSAVEAALMGSGPAPARATARAAARPRARAVRVAPRAKGEKRSPEELEALTAKLRGYIAKNPGQRIEQIARGLGTTTKELTLPAKKLLAAKQISTKGEKRATTYFPRG
ncbi:MAG: DNA-binding protein [Pseudomonadota bacterium]|nr:MAG: DNA-binding protein [Pseudomonadota bacterium]